MNKKVLESFKRFKIDKLEQAMVDGGEDDQSSYLPMYRTVDADEFPIGQYIYNKTGQHVQNMFRASHSHGGSLCHHADDVFQIISEFGFRHIFSSDTYDQERKITISRSVYEVMSEDEILILLVGGLPKFDEGTKPSKDTFQVHLSIVSGGADTLYKKVKQKIISKYKKIKVQPNNVNLVIASSHGYDTQEFDLPKQRIDIALNYGDAFVPVHKQILESLNRPNGKGLVLLHGSPGTGKTHYLKYLASKIKDKKVLFIPPYLADFITSPEMTPFLIDNSNSVLFIEDAERVISDREEGGSTGVSNILNITDGILSDILNIQIVATFNMDKQKIDSALLRKGRLIAEHRFGSLSLEDSNRLLSQMHKGCTTDKPLTLTEIYNYKENHFVSEEPVRKIGFGTR
jgi:hypothetical protein